LGGADPGAPGGSARVEDGDLELLSRASELFARAVRRGLVSEGCESGSAAADAPGVVELDASGEPVRASSSAEPLLAELSGGTVEARRSRLPRPSRSRGR
jgi:hypothetical protein